MLILAPSISSMAREEFKNKDLLIFKLEKDMWVPETYDMTTMYITEDSKKALLMDEGITKIYCGHYPYVKKTCDKQYITDMRMLAEALDNGTAPKAMPHPQKISIGSANPMMVTQSAVTIVFDPEHIK